MWHVAQRSSSVIMYYINATHLKNSKLIKFICCFIQIDSGNVVHLKETSKKHQMATSCPGGYMY